VKKTLTIILSIIWTTAVFGQATTGYHRVNQLLQRGTSGTDAQVVPRASVQVTSTTTGLLATIYRDPLLTSQIVSGSVSTDVSGNYDYYIPLNYCVNEQVSSPGQGSYTTNNICANSSGVSTISGPTSQFAITSPTTTPVITIANSFTFPGFAFGKVINGVSYSQNYTGSTLAERVNACIIDAETGANGNTSHVCDSRGESGGQYPDQQMTIGDTAFDAVTWVLPTYCRWHLTGTTNFTGTQSGIYQYGGSSIEGPKSIFSASQSPCEIDNRTSNGALYAMYTADTSNAADAYFSAGGFFLLDDDYATGVSYTVTAPAVMMVGAGNDTSNWHDIQIYTYNPTNYALQVGLGGQHLPCCAAHFDSIMLNGSNTSATLLNVVSPSTPSGGWPNGISFRDLSIGHPAPGQPIFNCAYNGGIPPELHIFNLYEESNLTDTTTTLNQISGCNIDIYGMEVKNEGTTPSTATIFQNATTTATVNGFQIHGLSVASGFTFPATAYVGTYTGATVLTDANGVLGSWQEGLSYATNFQAITQVTTPLIRGVSSTLNIGSSAMQVDTSGNLTIHSLSDSTTLTASGAITFPAIAAGSGTYCVEIGTTGILSSTACPTFSGNLPGTTVNSVPYQSASGTTSYIAPVNSGVFQTTSAGVPYISATLPVGVYATNMVLTTPNIGTPSAGVATNLSGTATALTAGSATVISTNGTGNQVWGMNSGATAQGWQTISGGAGTVTNFAAPSGSWPAWLVPTVTNSTSTPSLAVAATATGTGSVVLSASPALTGVPTAPTAAFSTNTTQVATTAFVISEINTGYDVATSQLWSIQPLLFSTSTMLGPVYYTPISCCGNPWIVARLSGTISCTVAPVILLMDLGSVPTTSYGSATSVVSLTTGTSDGVYQNIGSTTLIAGHWYGIAFSAGTCVTAPTFDISVSAGW